jgi:hypothetical protein
VPTPCYLIEDTDRQLVTLRRFAFGLAPDEEPSPAHRACPEAPTMPSGYRYGCDATSPPVGIVPLELTADGYQPALDPVSRNHPAWPTVCERCGLPLEEDDEWQTNGDPFVRVVAALPGAALAVGDEVPHRQAPPGAMWFAKWAEKFSAGFDGRALIVRLPDGHDWRVDGEATNCTRPGDKSHRCWLREGEPPYVTVGKTPDDLTCSAGAGSILSPGYHGFLHAGVLT